MPEQEGQHLNNSAFALAGRMGRVRLLTQGAALGYVVLPLRGVSLASFAPSYDSNRLLFYLANVL